MDRIKSPEGILPLSISLFLCLCLILTLFKVQKDSPFNMSDVSKIRSGDFLLEVQKYMSDVSYARLVNILESTSKTRIGQTNVYQLPAFFQQMLVINMVFGENRNKTIWIKGEIENNTNTIKFTAENKTLTSNSLDIQAADFQEVVTFLRNNPQFGTMSYFDMTAMEKVGNCTLEINYSNFDHFMGSDTKSTNFQLKSGDTIIIAMSYDTYWKETMLFSPQF